MIQYAAEINKAILLLDYEKTLEKILKIKSLFGESVWNYIIEIMNTCTKVENSTEMNYLIKSQLILKFPYLTDQAIIHMSKIIANNPKD